jgi:pimeloyl-ACP methyl ester carboxylesterase
MAFAFSRHGGSADWASSVPGLERRTAFAHGYRISYVIGGRGEPLVLLHGLGASSASWRFTAPALMERYTVVMPDYLGSGESEKPDVDYSIDLLARTMLALMDAIGIDRATLIGHSLGGGVAMWMYDLAPERVDRLVLVSSGGMGRELHWLLRISVLPGAEGVIGALSSPRLYIPQASRAMEQRRLRRLHVETVDLSPTVLERLHSLEARQAFISILRASIGLAGQKVSAVPRLHTVDVPTLLVWGDRDQTIPLTHGIAAASLMPRAHLEVLPNCYHRPQLEAPNAFNDLVRSFLRAEEWPPPADRAAALARYSALAARQRARRRWQSIAPAAAVAVSIPAIVLGTRRRSSRAG